MVITTTIQCITPYFFRNYMSLVSRCICNFFLLLSTLCPYSLLTPNPAGYFVSRGSVQSFTLLLAKVGRSGGSFSKQAIARRRWLVHNHPECIELNCYCALKLLHMWYDKTQFSIEIIISSTLKEECDRSELNLFLAGKFKFSNI